MKARNLASLLLLSATLFGAAPDASAAQEWITLAQQNPPLVADSTKPISTSEVISLQKGQERLQLFLTYENGVGAAPGFKWLRIASSSMNYVSERQFAGKKDLTLNVTGELTWSGNQLMINAGGEKGSSFSWILRTPKPTITSVSPTSVNSGDSLTITGTNLCTSPDGNIVTIGGQAARVSSATPTQLVVVVPEETKSGKLPIGLTTAGITVAVPNTMTVAITSQPYITKLSQDFVAPGETCTIYGEGFSSNASDNEVYIGPYRCEILSATDTSLTVRAAGALSDGWSATNIMGSGGYFQIKVSVKGVKSRNQATIRCSNV